MPSRSPAPNGFCCPPVRRVAEDTLIIADGFSCREQIAQCTERRAMHIAEITRLALRQKRITSADAAHQQCGQAVPGDRD